MTSSPSPAKGKADNAGRVSIECDGVTSINGHHPAMSPPFLLFQVSRRWGTEDGSTEGQRNNILQKAVSLYVGQLALKYDSALVVLSSIKEKGNRDEESYNMVISARQFLHTYNMVVVQHGISLQYGHC